MAEELEKTNKTSEEYRKEFQKLEKAWIKLKNNIDKRLLELAKRYPYVSIDDVFEANEFNKKTIMIFSYERKINFIRQFEKHIESQNKVKQLTIKF